MKHFLKGKLKGVFAFFATMLVAVSLAPTAAFAATTNTGKLKVSGLEGGETVSIYQFIANTVDSDTNQVNNTVVNGFTLNLEEYADTKNGTDGTEEWAQKIAAQISDSTAHQDKTAGENDKSVTFEDVATGSYLVLITNEKDATISYQNIIVNVLNKAEGGTWTVENGEATVKSSPVKVTKSVGASADDATHEDVDTVSVGGTVYFQVEVTLPKYAAGAKNRSVTIADQADEGLKVNFDSYVVKLGEGDTQKTLQKGEDKDYTVYDNGTISLNNPVALGGQKLFVTYTATIDDASYATAKKNTATLEYSQNSVNDTKASAADDAFVTVHSIKLTKKGSDNKLLKDATFELKQGEEVVKTLTTGENGVITFDGLGKGTYTLHETKAPTGYDLAEDVTINASDFTAPVADKTWEGHQVTKEIVDVASKAGVLPTTGGPGTVAMTVAGVVVMAGAACFVVRSRKQN